MAPKLKPYVYGVSAFIIVVVAITAGYFLRPIVAPEIKLSTNTLSPKAPTPTVYTNTWGNKWSILPTADFTVSSASGSKISFLEGKIDPLNVHPGETQNMRLVIMSGSGLSSVIAEIETDHGTTTVALHKTGTVAAKDLNPRLFQYTINSNNQLQILTTS
jgi:hypothetical protein